MHFDALSSNQGFQGADSNENKNQNREASAFEGILAGATAGALNQNRQQEMSAEQNKPTEEVAAAPVVSQGLQESKYLQFAGQDY